MQAPSPATAKAGATKGKRRKITRVSSIGISTPGAESEAEGQAANRPVGMCRGPFVEVRMNHERDLKSIGTGLLVTTCLWVKHSAQGEQGTAVH